MAVLFAQFFCGTAGKFGHGLLQIGQLGHRVAKAAGAGIFLI
jgi:hypothetical protein